MARKKDLLNYKHMHALSKRERVRILAVLIEREASPKELAAELNEGLSQVSYHVSVLRECRLIKLKRTTPRRGAVEHFYRAVNPTLIPPDAWDHLPSAVRKGISISVLQQFFDDALASLKAGIFDDKPGELGLMPLVLDRPGVEELGKLTSEFVKSVLALQAKASERLSKAKGRAADKTSATVFLASFLSARNPEDGKNASASKRR
jgi:DNA-binding transcriptional ArsR family regulator